MLRYFNEFPENGKVSGRKWPSLLRKSCLPLRAEGVVTSTRVQLSPMNDWRFHMATHPCPIESNERLEFTYPLFDCDEGIHDGGWVSPKRSTTRPPQSTTLHFLSLSPQWLPLGKEEVPTHLNMIGR